MNSSQLNFIAQNPNIQELISRLQCEPTISTEAAKINTAISARISNWFTEFSSPPLTPPSGPFKSQEAISTYISQFKQRYGVSSCPF